MPFGTRLLTQPLPAGAPDVEIFFHGQLLLRSEDSATCEVGINPIASNHVLSVEVRTRMRDQPDLINMRHVGPLHFRRPVPGGPAVQPGMLIEIIPAANTRAAWACVGTDALNFETGAGRYDEDFRWIMNLEGNLFHNDKQLNPAVFGTTDTIKLQGGEYFFRTGFRSPHRLRYERRGGGKAPLNLRRIGAIAQASVYLIQNQSLVLRWNDGVRNRTLTLTKSTEGATYEIYVQHTPLFMNDGEQLGHDELGEFYRVIPEVSMGDRFTFRTADEPQGEKGTPNIPCQVMTLDGPGGN